MGEANVVSYSSVISACARKGDKDGAAKWLARMLGSGIEADSICYNAVIDACAKAKDASGAEKWMEKMLEAKAAPTTVTYNAVKCLRQVRGRPPRGALASEDVGGGIA